MPDVELTGHTNVSVHWELWPYRTPDTTLCVCGWTGECYADPRLPDPHQPLVKLIEAHRRTVGAYRTSGFTGKKPHGVGIKIRATHQRAGYEGAA